MEYKMAVESCYNYEESDKEEPFYACSSNNISDNNCDSNLKLSGSDLYNERMLEILQEYDGF